MTCLMHKHTSFSHMGWLHVSKWKYRQVSAKNGGGTRGLEYIKEDAQTVDSLITKGKQIFYQNGKQVVMAIYLLWMLALARTKSFTDSNGIECSLQDLLKTQCMFSSQYYIYLITHKQKVFHKLKEKQINS